jgi:CRISPR system Cascade subunit CasE
MYLSRLTLDLRNRKVQRSLADPYRLHQAILHAFPPDQPGGGCRVLFRVEPEQDDARARILVQSELRPVWTNPALHEHLPVAHVDPPKEFVPSFKAGQVLRFRLRANPTRRSQEKRLPVLGEDPQIAWLRSKLERAGFQLMAARRHDEGMRMGSQRKGERSEQLTFVSVLFEGAARVVEPIAADAALRSGIGSAKAFGFGLLSLARG